MALEKTHRFLLTDLLHWLSFVTARTPMQFQTATTLSSLKSNFEFLSTLLFSLYLLVNILRNYVLKSNFLKGI